MMDDNSPLDPHGIPIPTDEELGEELAELISRLKSKYGTDCNKWTSHIKFAYDSNPENTVEFIEGVMEDLGVLT